MGIKSDGALYEGLGLAEGFDDRENLALILGAQILEAMHHRPHLRILGVHRVHTEELRGRRILHRTEGHLKARRHAPQSPKVRGLDGFTGGDSVEP